MLKDKKRMPKQRFCPKYPTLSVLSLTSKVHTIHLIRSSKDLMYIHSLINKATVTIVVRLQMSKMSKKRPLLTKERAASNKAINKIHTITMI